MRPCPACLPYGSDPPGFVPVLVPRTPEELALPAERRPPAQIIWVPCTGCHGSVASCCEAAGANGADVNYPDTLYRPAASETAPAAAGAVKFPDTHLVN
jgi:hypothetical protein